jgi:hypothetical protein
MSAMFGSALDRRYSWRRTFDMPEETYRLTIGDVGGEGTAVSAPIRSPWSSCP